MTQWTLPEKSSPKPWNLYGSKKQATTGAIASAHAQLTSKGYTLRGSGIECPIPGSEGGTVYFEIDGKRAIWDSGNVYMRE